MKTEIDWSKAPEGFPLWLEDIRPERLGDRQHDRSCWAFDKNGEYALYTPRGIPGWWAASRKNIDFKVHERPAPWIGAGLPPVGIDVEIYFDGYWGCATVLAHTIQPGQPDQAIAQMGKHGFVSAATADGFRPIRTAYQPTELETFTQQIYRDAGIEPDLAERLFDKGYRRVGQ